MSTITTKVRDVIAAKNGGVVTIDIDAPVRAGAQLMAARNVGSLMVMAEGALAGIVTWHDVLEAVADRCEDTKKMRAVMTADVVTTTEDAPLHEVESTMIRRGIRHLPVLRNGELIGVLSRIDVLRLYLTRQESLSTDLHAYVTGTYPG